MVQRCEMCDHINHDFTHVCNSCGGKLDKNKGKTRFNFMDRFKNLFKGRR